MSYKMHIIIVPFGEGKWINTEGNTECVEFVRQTTGAPPTAQWVKGIYVKEAKEGDIKPYTAIATFDGAGKYPTDKLGRHAAVYLSHDKEGINVLDQWNKQGKVLERKIKFNQPKTIKRSNNGDTFYVVD